MPKGKKNDIEKQQTKVIDAWNANKIEKDGRAGHNYTGIVKVDGVLKKGSPAAITGATQKWHPKKKGSAKKNYIYIPSLRISGDRDDLRAFLSHSTFENSKRTVKNYLENAYSIDNTKKGEELHSDFEREKKLRDKFVKKDNETKEKVDPFDTVDLLRSVVDVDFIGDPAKQGKVARKTGKTSTSAVDSFASRYNNYKAKGKWVDVSRMDLDTYTKASAVSGKKPPVKKLHVVGTNIIASPSNIAEFSAAVRAVHGKKADDLIRKFKAAKKKRLGGSAPGSARSSARASSRVEESSSDEDEDEDEDDEKSSASSSESEDEESSDEADEEDEDEDEDEEDEDEEDEDEDEESSEKDEDEDEDEDEESSEDEDEDSESEDEDSESEEVVSTKKATRRTGGGRVPGRRR